MGECNRGRMEGREGGRDGKEGRWKEGREGGRAFLLSFLPPSLPRKEGGERTQ